MYVGLVCLTSAPGDSNTGDWVEKHARAQVKELVLDGEKRKCWRIHVGEGLVEFYPAASFIYEVGDISVNKGLFVAAGC